MIRPSFCSDSSWSASTVTGALLSVLSLFLAPPGSAARGFGVGSAGAAGVAGTAGAGRRFVAGWAPPGSGARDSRARRATAAAATRVTGAHARADPAQRGPDP